VPTPFAAGQDGYVVKLRPDGTHAWSKRFVGLDSQYSYSHFVAPLPNGRVAVGGSFADRTIFDGQLRTSTPNSVIDGDTYDGYLALFGP
jgi:hypothetical protein